MERIGRGLFLATLVLLPLGIAPVAPALHPRLQWSDVILAAALLPWLLSRPRPPGVRGLCAAGAAYLASATLAWALAGTPLAGGLKLAGIASLLAFAAMAAGWTRDARGAALAGRAIAIASAVAALSALAGALLFTAGVATPLLGAYGDLVPGSYPRSRGLFAHPNGLASFAIAAVGLVASPRAAVPRPIVRVLLALLCAATLASLSRGVLGLAVALAVASARSPARRAFAAFVTAAALLAMVTLSLGNLSLDPTRPAEARWLDAPSPRLQALATAGRTLWKHPLGSGPGSLPARVDARPFEAHCTPLNVAATLGAPAALALLAMPVLLWRHRGRPLERSAWGALLGLGVDALAQDVEDFRHVWLLLGWLWGAAGPDEPAGVP